MSIQHRDIDDANLHEPKGIISATNHKLYVANGSGGGAWRRLKNSDMDFSTPSSNVFGWNDIADSQYTSGAPRAILAATRTKLTNNKLATQTDTTRLGNIWDSTLNQFVIDDLNGAYLFRIGMKVTAAAAAGTPYVVKLEFESANGPTVVVAHDVAIKGGGWVNNVVITDFIYSGSFINNQAISLYLTADTAINLYDVGFVVHKMYTESSVA